MVEAIWTLSILLTFAFMYSWSVTAAYRHRKNLLDASDKEVKRYQDRVHNVREMLDRMRPVYAHVLPDYSTKQLFKFLYEGYIWHDADKYRYPLVDFLERQKSNFELRETARIREEKSKAAAKAKRAAKKSPKKKGK